MEQFSFVFTIFFMLLGPLKLAAPFATVTSGTDEAFKRAVAIRSALIASAVVAFVALMGTSLLSRYHISLDGLRIAGGLVLLLAALNTIFARPHAQEAKNVQKPPLQLAISPIVVPMIVPPAGVAAILIFMMLAPQYPGIDLAVYLALAIVMVLNFLFMYFHSHVAKAAGFNLVAQLIGAILIFMQVALAVETILDGVRHLAGVPPGN